MSSHGTKFRERLDGTLHIERLEPKRLSGRLEVWATGVSSDELDEDELQGNPLFYPGLRIEIAFDAPL